MLWQFALGENNWEELATMFDFPDEIRRLIYTTNAIEGYNRQIRKVTKNKAAFPSPEAARKLLFLANRNITAKWSAPVPKWAKILNQLAIRFDGRFPDKLCYETSHLHTLLDITDGTFFDVYLRSTTLVSQIQSRFEKVIVHDVGRLLWQVNRCWCKALLVKKIPPPAPSSVLAIVFGS